MRRPLDKDVQSERDVESSNAALKTLLGGSRQKSWMMGHGTPVRPTPRPSPSQAAEYSALLTQKENTIPPAPGPRGESNPTLTSIPVNAPSNEERCDTQSEDTRPPSTVITAQCRQPTSSEANIRATREPQVSEALSRPSSSSSRLFDQLATQSRIPSVNPASSGNTDVSEKPPLPSPVLLRSEKQSQISEKGEENYPIDVSVQSLSHEAVPENQSDPYQSVPSPQISALSGLGIISGPASVQQQASQRQNDQQISRATGDMSLSRINTTSAPRIVDIQSQAVQNGPQSYPSPSKSAPANPFKRQRIQTPVMPPLKSRVVEIHKHIESVGGQLNLNSGLELPRFQLLIDACNKEDSFYVALHQLFCAWDSNRQEVLSIAGFPNATVLTSAFQILGLLIRDNDQLAPNHRIWFSKFPGPLDTLLESSESYRNIVADVGVFLERLATDWSPLSIECTERGYPPLVDELVNRWGLLSPTLQSVVFTATRRNLGVRDEEVGTRMENLFRRDRREHLALAARFSTARPPTAKEVQERNSALRIEYLALHHLRQQRSSSSIAASPMLRGPTTVRPGNAATPSSAVNNSLSSVATSPPQASVNQLPRHHYLPSSIPTSYWQATDQHQQGLARLSNSSPDPALMAVRPPTLGNNRANMSTPSTTFLPSLATQSPVQQGLQFAPDIGSNVQMQPHHTVQPMYAGRVPPNIGFQYSPAERPHTTFQQQQQVSAQQQVTARRQQQQHMSTFPRHHQQVSQNSWPQNQSPFLTLPQQHMQHQVIEPQQQIRLDQQTQNPNRAAQLRSGSIGAIDPYPGHVRNDTISSTGNNGHNSQMMDHVRRPLPRVDGRPVPARARMIPDEVQIYSQKHRLERGLIPPLNYMHSSAPAVPEIAALHQAHLRSPRLVAADTPPPGMAPDNPSLRFYQAIKGFALPPTKISANTPLSKYDFRIPESQLALVPHDTCKPNGHVITREFRRGTLQYRLRCIQMQKPDAKCSIADWLSKDTVWPESVSLAINMKHLELRRKNHHGKDLPLDITPYVILSGPNANCQISLSIIRGRSKMKDFSYFLAVEVIEVLQHDQVLEIVGNNRIPANISLEKIKRSLAGPAGGGDDDIAMVVSDVSIDLADPFTARIYEIPVRGSSCLHRECFDLKTFLLTRASKPKRQGQPCMVDVWRCPLCGKDARPHNLQIDDFLASIREELEAQGKLDVKAIWIGADGKWRPKVEKRKALRDPNDSDFSDDDSERPSDLTISTKQPQSNIVVIDLDDD
ncbi:MIZ/SP-RING zinc finger protein [Diplocarpon rosae]|nr:MIZ/SP-RING zinc finger protein [Diplocarpon rosae]